MEWQRLSGVVHVPAGFGEAVPGAKAWAGQIAEQYGEKQAAQYLEGGGQQLIVDLGALSDEINTIGENVKKFGKAEEHVINGVRVEFYPTNWTNVEGVYGYSGAADHLHATAQTRKLASDETHTKMTNSTANASAQAGKATEEQSH